MKIILYTVHATELIAAILASIYFFKYNKTPLKYFFIYLWYVFINETLAQILIPRGVVTYQLTNFYGLITSLYVVWICSKYVIISNLKNIIKILLGIILVIHCVELSLKGLNQPWVISKTVGPFVCLIALFVYLMSLFKTRAVINPFKELMTYFLIGFALFFVASPVILIARIYFLDNVNMGFSLSYIMGIIAILMYLIFSFGFIQTKGNNEAYKHLTE